MNRILEEMIEVLFLESTIEQVYEINKYVGNKDYIFSRFGIDFRIHKTESIYTTLEARLTDEFGNFYKPIGFYDFDIDDNITQIGFLKEFQISYENISHKIPAEIKIKARHFSLIDNVYAALASREVGNVVRKMFASPNYSPYNHLDISKFQVSNLVVNNLPVQVKTSIMGAIEAVYNDENNDFEEDLTVIFQNNDGISIHCNEISYSTMQEKEMLSIFKAV